MTNGYVRGAVEYAAMMMIWALGRRNRKVIWRPYRLKMQDHLKMHKILRRGCLAISADNVEEEEALLCIT